MTMWRVELKPEFKRKIKNPELFAKGIGNVYVGVTVAMGGVLVMLFLYFTKPEEVLLPSLLMLFGLGMGAWGEWQKYKAR